MSTFYDFCLARFISYAIAKERDHIKGGANFEEYSNGDTCHTSSINEISSPISCPISPIYDKFKDKMNEVINGEASCEFYDTPWWMNLRIPKYAHSSYKNLLSLDIILYDEKGRYYPVFHSFVVREVKGSHYEFKKQTGKDKMSACADLLERTQKELKGCSSSGYGRVRSVEPTKYHLEQFYWLDPKDEIEEKSFSTVLQNQLKIMAFVEEYSTFGLFNQKRKKEILEAFDNMMKYSKVIVTKAILDRIGSDFYQKDEKLVDKAIDAEQKRLEQQQSFLNSVDLTAFKKRKEIHEKINLYKASIKELQQIKAKMPQRIKQIKEVFEETEKRFSVLFISKDY